METLHKHKIVIVIILLLIQHFYVFSQLTDSDSNIFKCYTDRYKEYQYISVVKSINLKGSNFSILSFIQPRGNVPIQYVLCQKSDSLSICSNSTKTITDLYRNDTVILKQIDLSRMTSFIKLKQEQFFKEYSDTIKLYEFSKGLSFIWLVAYGEHSGIVSYFYYDSNINHYCILDVGSNFKNQKIIKKILRMYGKKILLEAFIKRAKYPKPWLFDSNGNEVII